MARGPGKGKTNNPNGRPKGVPNKITMEIREALRDIAYGEIEDVRKALAQLKKENVALYLDKYEKLLAYTIPKKRDITTDDQPIVPNIKIIEERTYPEDKADGKAD